LPQKPTWTNAAKKTAYLKIAAKIIMDKCDKKNIGVKNCRKTLF
jgi:hypothetical protein